MRTGSIAFKPAAAPIKFRYKYMQQSLKSLMRSLLFLFEDESLKDGRVLTFCRVYVLHSKAAVLESETERQKDPD